jgi:hypothetical protein
VKYTREECDALRLSPEYMGLSDVQVECKHRELADASLEALLYALNDRAREIGYCACLEPV